MKKNLIKKAIIDVVPTDDKTVQQAQVSYLGKTETVEVVNPYGLASSAPTGSQMLLFQVNGQEEYLAGLASDINNRLKGLKIGEVVLYNTQTQSFVKLNSDGELELNGNVDYAVRFLELQTSFNQLKSDFDTLVGVFNAHIHNDSLAAPTTPPTTTASTSTADISPAKVDNVRIGT